MKHSPPFLEAATRELVAAGAEHLVGLVLAPHYSRMSVQAYGDRVQAALAAEGGGRDVSLCGRGQRRPAT